METIDNKFHFAVKETLKELKQGQNLFIEKIGKIKYESLF